MILNLETAVFASASAGAIALAFGAAPLGVLLIGRRMSLADRRISPRAFLECRTIHIPDRSDPAVMVEFPDNL